MYTKEKLIRVKEQRIVVINGVRFVVPFESRLYSGSMYYSTDADTEKTAILNFEDACRELGILIGRGTMYEFRHESKELFIAGTLLLFGEDRDAAEAGFKKLGVRFGKVAETEAGYVVREEEEITD